MTSHTTRTFLEIFHQALIQAREELIEEVNEINEEISSKEVAVILELPSIVVFDDKGAIVEIKECGEMFHTFVNSAFEKRS